MAATRPLRSTFSRVFIPNRGEIAVRIIRACQELGLVAVLGVSEADRSSLAARRADEVAVLGPTPVAQSYLNLARVIEAALASRCEALHPGYGLLSERAELAEACAAVGIVFVGPGAAAMRLLGDKMAARATALEVGVPVIAGSGDLNVAALPDAELARVAGEIGYPLAVKAAGGGGGRGLRVAQGPGGLGEAVAGASREALAYFGDGRVYLERYFTSARHIEVQVAADAHGHVLALGERDCSVQRRHQKLVEEAPAPRLEGSVRRALARSALRVARAAGYRSLGTAEFLVTGGGHYFLEMNARLQVEHPITELVWGVDLVQAQLRMAAGETAARALGRPAPRGHAIEVRINAEDPSRDFQPSPGLITTWRPPGGAGVRIDSGVEAGSEVGSNYDSLIAKLCVWAEDRPRALSRLQRALADFEIEGVATTLPFAQGLLRLAAFRRGGVSTSVAGRVRMVPAPSARVQPLPATGPERRYRVEVEGEILEVRVRATAPAPRPSAGGVAPGAIGELRAHSAGARARGGAFALAGTEVRAPMAGTVQRLLREDGARVEAGDLLCVIEAMKMENQVHAHVAGALHWGVTAGTRVDAGQPLCQVTAAPSSDGKVQL